MTLMVILVGFKHDRAGSTALFTYARQRYGAQLGAAQCSGSADGRPPPCATALRRAAAAGCDGCPRGRVAPAFGVRQLSRWVAYEVTRRQARGAQGAPLKTYRKFSPIGQHPLSTSRRARLSLVGRLLRNAGGGQEAGNTCLRFHLMLYTWASRPTIGQVARSRRLTSSR
jgi:hypothetical protein